MRKKLSLLLAAIMLFTFCFGAINIVRAEDENIVVNGSFEDGETGWWFRNSGWQGFDEISTEQAAEGTHSLKMSGASNATGATGNNAGAYYQGNYTAQGDWNKNLDIEEGKTYELSVKVFFPAGTSYDYSKTAAYAEVYGGVQDTLRIDAKTDKLGEWQTLTGKFLATDSKTSFRLMFNAMTEGQSVYFDDVVIKLAEGGQSDWVPDKSLCRNGSFENGIDTAATSWPGSSVWQRLTAEQVMEKYGEKYADTLAGFAPADGDYVMACDATDTAINPGSFITCEPNTDYLISAKIWRATSKGVVYVNLYDHNSRDIPGTNSGTDQVGKWVTVYINWNSGNESKFTPRMVLNHGTDTRLAGDPVFFDDIRVTKLSWDELVPYPATADTADAQFTHTFNTRTTSATVTVKDNKQYVSDVKDNNGNIWIDKAQEVELISKISDADVEWTYNGQGSVKKEFSAEDTIALNFTSKDGKYDLTAYWQAMDKGPVMYWTEITCASEASTYSYFASRSSNMLLNKQSDDMTLYYFNRSRVNDGSDPLFSEGVIGEKLTPSKNIFSVVQNGCNVTTGILPFQMIDVDNGQHGFYYGYYWSFGKILTRTDAAGNVGVVTMLSDDDSALVKREAGQTMKLPEFFFGAYVGDIDAGANEMKSWFWDYKITRSLHDNANEPHLETDTMTGSFDSVKKFFEETFAGVENYIELLKRDYDWTLPHNVNPRVMQETEDEWLPNADKYPNGMNYWEYLNEKGVKFSLYLADTYKAVDIGTAEGREAQLKAMMERFRPQSGKWATSVQGFDYWRSDFDVEGSFDYAKHEGLLYILDSMIDYSDEFRYESCSGGGSLKNFSTLERMSFLTNEDTAYPLNHRMALYAAAYMINPVQLKGDINMGYDKKDYGAIKKEYGSYYTDQYIVTDAEGNSLHAYESEEYLKYALRSTFLGASMICLTEDTINYANNKQVIADSWKLYKEQQRPILRGADVYHILEQPHGVSWDYTDWDGIMYYNEALDKGSVFLFEENETGYTSSGQAVDVPDEKVIKLKGLDADATYLVTFEDRTNLNGAFTGAQLMNDGILVTGMTEKYDSDIMWIEKTGTEEDLEALEIVGDKATIGKDTQLTFKTTPENIATPRVKWEVINFTGTATIDQNGLLTPLTAGKVIVKVTSLFNEDITALKLISISKPAPISISTLKVKLAATLYTYDGKVKKPAVTITDAKGNKIAASNYTVKYSAGRKSVGTYTVTVTMKGSYTGSKTLTFAIRGKQMTVSKLTALSKGFKATWKKQSYVTGYQVQYSTSSKFTAKTTKTSTISKYTTTSKTVTKLKAKTKYYVRVRSYKTTKIGGKNYNVYSAWSKAKAVTTKK